MPSSNALKVHKHLLWSTIISDRLFGYSEVNLLLKAPLGEGYWINVWHSQLEKHCQLEQLERLRSEDTPPPPHCYPYHWVILDPKSKEDKVKVTSFKNSPKFQMFEFWNGHYTRHTFWSCLIRCANMKWIRWVLLKIQSGHDSVHRRTDGQGDTSIPPFQLRWSGGV